MHVSFNEKEHLFLIKNEQGEYEVPTISSTGNAKEESVQLLRTIFGDLSSLKRPGTNGEPRFVKLPYSGFLRYLGGII